MQRWKNCVRKSFQRGTYLHRGDWRLWYQAEQRIAKGEDPAVVEADRAAKRAALPKPKSIQQLFGWNQDSGTHSVIDMMNGVSNNPDFGTVSPLTDDQLLSSFGKTTPTHAQIQQWEARKDYPIGNLRSSWEGLYIIVYEGNYPSELYFAGFSGD